jgi:hypothetical protein
LWLDKWNQQYKGFVGGKRDKRPSEDECFLTISYEKMVNIFGRFKQEPIALGLSELR